MDTFEGELGCDVAGCMDDTACNYNPNATISTEDCIYPELNADCEGNFVCDGVEFTLDMYDTYGDGWNGGTFGVVNWQTGEYEYGPVTLEDGASGTTQACFPQDMVWGCYIIQVGGGDYDEEIGWHLYGFEVFGSYVVDYSAGVSYEWESVGGELLTGDSQTIWDFDLGCYAECEDESGFCEGAMDYGYGAGAYDIGYGCPCLVECANNYSPDGEFDSSDNTDDPCEYGDVVVDIPGCTDSTADNYNADATSDDGSCEFTCAGTGTDDNGFVFDALGSLCKYYKLCRFNWIRNR